MYNCWKPDPEPDDQPCSPPSSPEDTAYASYPRRKWTPTRQRLPRSVRERYRGGEGSGGQTKTQGFVRLRAAVPR
ncbi:unnamed protein product [Cuscuta epithymum]|uniref:Uncharacterized protein n=1 Tax=Cuscuta epithymum TaxID=186058 RepID=A0AAV0G1V1_9ASTE|nr:unnamed protein product [Cuscuta epithymum]